MLGEKVWWTGLGTEVSTPRAIVHLQDLEVSRASAEHAYAYSISPFLMEASAND
jgi:hypothetical protein